jgi:hypothetical protein
MNDLTAFVQNPDMIVTRAAVHGAVRGRLAPPARAAITGGIAFRSASVHTDFPASNCRIDSEIVSRRPSTTRFVMRFFHAAPRCGIEQVPMPSCFSL